MARISLRYDHTVKELMEALAQCPPDAVVELELNVDYPSGEYGSEDWIVSPHIIGIDLPEPGPTRRQNYVSLEVVG